MTRAEASDFTVVSVRVTAFLITVSLATDTHCVFAEVNGQLRRLATIELTARIWKMMEHSLSLASCTVYCIAHHIFTQAVASSDVILTSTHTITQGTNHMHNDGLEEPHMLCRCCAVR